MADVSHIYYNYIMKITKNIGSVDRVVRMLIAVLLFLTAFFFAYGVLQIVLYILAIAMVVTSLVRFCGLYTLLGVTTCPLDEKKLSTFALLVSGALIILVAVAFSYYSIVFTKKNFIEDYNRMNHYYKQTLFFTGQNNREDAVKNYNYLVKEYDDFYTKYSKYRPYSIAFDKKFGADIAEVKVVVTSLESGVTSGDLSSVHKELETVRPVFQDILKRNGFSLFAVYLVDFHDAMEKVIAGADAKDAQAVITAYEEVNEKLLSVESVENDAEVQIIRQKLEQVVSSARSGRLDVLSSQAGELKTSFVKVYLKRG